MLFNIYDKDLTFKNINNKREMSLSIDDIPYIREHLIKTIREKTGFNFKEYHEKNKLKQE